MSARRFPFAPGVIEAHRPRRGFCRALARGLPRALVWGLALAAVWSLLC